MAKEFNPFDSAMAIRRRQTTLDKVPEKHRPAVQKALRQEGRLADYARKQIVPSNRFQPVRGRATKIG
jgi:hypothetical protein